MSNRRVYVSVTGGALLVAFVVLLVIVGRSSVDDIVHFVVPGGFEGMFVVVPDNGGTPAKRDGKQFTIHVPADGRVSLSNVSIIRRWHRVTASYDDGTVLPTGTDAGLRDDVVALRSLFTTHEGHSWYVVGTKTDQMEQHEKGPPR